VTGSLGMISLKGLAQWGSNPGLIWGAQRPRTQGRKLVNGGPGLFTPSSNPHIW